MYNRYIPQDTSYTRLEEERPLHTQNDRRDSRQTGPITSRLFGSLGGLKELLNGQDGNRRGLNGLLKNLDSGDVLLLLITILLLVEGEDVDLAIALGLVFLLGLGDGNQKESK